MVFFKKTFKIFLFAALLIFFLGSFILIQARDLEVDYPSIEGQEALDSSATMPEYVKYIFNFAIALIGIFALAGLIWAGILRMTALDDPKKIESSQKQIIASIFGLLLLSSSYLILKTINPELIELGEPVTEPAEVVLEDRFEIPIDITSINVELPIETRIKGVEDKDFGIFEEKRLERIETLAKDIAKKALLIKGTSSKLVGLAGECKCDHGPYKVCNGYTCSYPICAGDCTEQQIDEDTYECRNVGCRGLCCTSDPCCCQRKDIDKNKGINRVNFKELRDLKEKLSIERIELMTEVDKLKETLDIMKEDCPLSGILSRDNFISLKDYYNQHEWELKRVRYWDEVEYLVSNSYADFYCPIGGTRLGYSPPPEIENATSAAEAFASSALEFQDYITSIGEFETTVSCQRTIPFGDVIDQKKKKKKKKIQEAGMIQLQLKMMEKIDELHLLINQCLSSNCNPICECEDPPCVCSPSHCSGNPCPMGKIQKTFDEIVEIQKEIEKRKNEIVSIVKTGTKIVILGNTVSDTRGEIQEYLEEDFDKMAKGIHTCIAVPEEIAPGWLFLNCERSMGAIGPDGEILGASGGSVDIDNLFSNLSSLADEYQEGLFGDCECFDIDECKEEFEHLVKNHKECKVIEECYEYNFFCCRVKD